MMDHSFKFAMALQEKFDGYEVTVDAGNKFDRIVVRQTKYGPGGQRMVLCFVEVDTGRVIKSAGWKAPQRGKKGLAYRYDLSTPEGFAHAVEKADPYGGFCYEGRA